MSAELDDTVLPIARGVVVGVAGIVAAVIVELALESAPTPLAAISVLGVALVAGKLAGPAASVPAALVGCYVFGDHHLADRHGVLGTSSVAVTFLLVQALAIGAAVVGNRSWRRAGGWGSVDPGHQVDGVKKV
jgi:hypothetical protein